MSPWYMHRWYSTISSMVHVRTYVRSWKWSSSNGWMTAVLTTISNYIIMIHLTFVACTWIHFRSLGLLLNWLSTQSVSAVPSSLDLSLRRLEWHCRAWVGLSILLCLPYLFSASQIEVSRSGLYKEGVYCTARCIYIMFWFKRLRCTSYFMLFILDHVLIVALTGKSCAHAWDE